MSECDEHDRCIERDKAECEWCMEEATIPANPTAGIAATPAWRDDLDTIEGCEEISECADGCCTFFTPRHNDECIRLAAYIESLEAERDALRLRIEEMSHMEDSGLRVNAEIIHDVYPGKTVCMCEAIRKTKARLDTSVVMP